jgi:hypothetical protein
VYAQTFLVDIREVVRPDRFTPADAADALQLAQRGVCQPDDLPGNPRWFAARTDRWCMAGVACMNTAVGARPERTRDRHGRPCYAVLAAVCFDQAAPLPAIDPQLVLVRPLFKYIEARWNERIEDKGRVVCTSETYDWSAAASPVEALELNTDDRWVFCHPVTDGPRLWGAASRHRGRVTVYLNMPSLGEARHPLCLNATVVGLTEALEVRRKPQEPDPPDGTTVMPEHDREAGESGPQRVENRQVARDAVGQQATEQNPEPPAAPEADAPERPGVLGSLGRKLGQAVRAVGRTAEPVAGFFHGLLGRGRKEPIEPRVVPEVEPEPPQADEPPAADRPRPGGPRLDPRWGFHPVERPPDPTDSGPPTEGPARDRR